MGPPRGRGRRCGLARPLRSVLVGAATVAVAVVGLAAALAVAVVGLAAAVVGGSVRWSAGEGGSGIDERVHGGAGRAVGIGLPVEDVAAGRPVRRIDLVGAATHPTDAEVVGLVPEGVGQRLAGAGAGDDVAVPVEPGVDLGQGRCPVPGEDLQAGLSEERAGDRHRGAGGGRDRRVLVVGRASTRLPGERGVQPVAAVGQLVEDVEPLLGIGDQRAVELLQAVEELLPLDVDGQAVCRRQACGEPEGEGGRVAEVGGSAEDHGRLPVGPVAVRFGHGGALSRWGLGAAVTGLRSDRRSGVVRGHGALGV